MGDSHDGADASRKGGRSVDLAILAALIMTVFIVQWLLARRWAALGLFSQDNVLFDSDSMSEFRQYAYRPGFGRFTHPLFAYFLSVPIKLLAVASSWAGLVRDQSTLREALALCVAPLASGLKGAFTFAAFRLLGLGRARALAGTLVGVLAFSSVVFGATPSTYSLSGCALSLLTLLAVSSGARVVSWIDRLAWLAAGLLAVGVTSSNVVYFGFMELARNQSKRLLPTRRQLARAVLAGALILASSLILAISFAMLRGARGSVRSVAIPADFLRQFTPSPREQLSQLVRFPEILTRSLIATTPVAEADAHAIRQRLPIPFQLTYNRLPVDGRSIALWGLGVAVLGCTCFAYRNGGRWRPIGFATLASVVTFGVIFSIFGLNTFLYSQYWQVPATFLIGSSLGPDSGTGRGRWIPVVALLFVMLAADWHVVGRITEKVAAAGATELAS